MKIRKIRIVSFSPTGNSQRVVNAIVSGIRGIPIENIDLTHQPMVSAVQFASNELAVIGAPVYAGRVAPLALKRLSGVVADHTPAVVVVTYGNREIEDALIELKDFSEKAGFRPIAAAAFVGEHSFSTPKTPIAANRPDPVDLATAEAFGMKIAEKVANLQDREPAACLEVPGNRPYKEAMGPLAFAPTVLETRCTQCAACIPSCPTGAISLNKGIEIARHQCNFCCACIKNCPEDALEIDAAPIKQKIQWLHEHCKERREPELYL